eukprot:gene17167-22682_t
MQNVKCVVCGDGAVGKTCMMITYTQNSFPEGYVPTVFDNYSKDVQVNGKAITLGLWDTAGEDDYDSMRPLSYAETDVFLLCFAIDSHTSFMNIKSKWLPEIQRYSPGTPFIIVGTKIDKRNDSNSETFINTSRGVGLKGEIGAYSYVECSSLTRDGLSEVFDEAIKCALISIISKKLPSKKKKSCILS